MSSDPRTLLTEEEYLVVERRAEFHRGETFAVAGVSRRHNRIVTNMLTALDNQLRERPATSTRTTCG